MEVKGKLIVKNDTVAVSEKFSKRTFVIKTDETYPQEIELQLTQDKCNLIDGINLGDELNVSINIMGRSWTNPQGEVKYFNTLQAWKIQREAAAPSSAPAPKEDLPF